MTTRPLKILLVEDDSNSRLALETTLRLCGHTVHSAGSFKAALELAEVHTIDVALCDIGLPDQDGWNFIRELRRRFHIPGVAISGFAMWQDVQTSKEAGFCAHLTKPVDPEDLEVAIELAAQLVPPARTRHGIPINQFHPHDSTLPDPELTGLPVTWVVCRSPQRPIMGS